jgi:hypothetical protein
MVNLSSRYLAARSPALAGRRQAKSKWWGDQDIRLSGGEYQNIRVSGIIISHSLTFPDILMPGILPPDFLVP